MPERPTELQRRQSLADKLEALFTIRPGEWISLAELARVGGTGGFRTRISELRLKRGMHIEHNGFNGAKSAHRYVPNPLGGRDAGTFLPGNPETGKLNFDGHQPGAYQR